MSLHKLCSSHQVAIKKILTGSGNLKPFRHSSSVTPHKAFYEELFQHRWQPTEEWTVRTPLYGGKKNTFKNTAKSVLKGKNLVRYQCAATS
jgi:hypothetical protein